MKDKEKQYISMKEMLTKRSVEPITNCNCRKEGAFVDLLNQEMSKVNKDLMELCKLLFENWDGTVINVAKIVLEHYQPKLPEDSVVLSKEEYDCLKRIEKAYDPFWFCAIDGCEGARKECKDTCEMSIFVKERKKTVEKILNEIAHIQVGYNSNAQIIAFKVTDKLQDLAKQFGIKIKE